MNTLKTINIFETGEPAVKLSSAATSKLTQNWVNWQVPLALILATLSEMYREQVTAKLTELVALTLSLDTSAYTAGDVLAATQEVPGALRVSGGSAKLTSVVLVDQDDNTAADITLVFFSEDVALGAENAAPSITDANALKILGTVLVPSASFVDLGGAKVATVVPVSPLPVTAPSGTSIYVAAICAGTPTQTAAGIKLNLTFAQD